MGGEGSTDILVCTSGDTWPGFKSQGGSPHLCSSSHIYWKVLKSWIACGFIVQCLVIPALDLGGGWV